MKTKTVHMPLPAEAAGKQPVKVTEKSSIPENAVILGAKGYRKNGIGISIVKYKANNEEFTAWIPLGGGAA